MGADVFGRAAAAILLAVLLILEICDILYATRQGCVCQMPVLMCHHLTQESAYPTVVSTSRFREQMAALRMMGRFNITEDFSGRALIRQIEEQTDIFNR